MLLLTTFMAGKHTNALRCLARYIGLNRLQNPDRQSTSAIDLQGFNTDKHIHGHFVPPFNTTLFNFLVSANPGNG